MPDSFYPFAEVEADSHTHVKPYVQETLTSRALHFSICEIQSRMDLRRPYALDLEYTATMMGFLIFNSAPRSLAMIGLGGGSLTKFCHRFLPDTRLTVVEINPHVIALRDAFSVPPDDARLSVLLGDGADFVRAPPAHFDILMVDGFDSEGTPPARSSQRFYDDCRDALQEQGLLVLNLHSGHRDYATHLARLQQSFGDELLVVDHADRSNSIVFACRGRLGLRRPKPSLLRKPPAFDRQSWDELTPGFKAVRAALQRLPTAA
jgi:spermidine synthase